MPPNQPSNYLSESDYDFVFSKTPRLCVDIIIKSHAGILLIKRNIEPYKGKYHLAGGRIRFRETISAAIKRIAKTELQADLQEHAKFCGYMEFFNEKRKGKKQHTVSIVFRCNLKKGASVNGKWFKQCPENMIPEHKKFLIDNPIYLYE